MAAARNRLVIVTVLAAALSGCGSTGAEPTSRPAPSGETGGLTAAEMEAIFRERRDAARDRYTPADVAFMQGMIHHHAQALHMSRLVPSRTEDASLRTMAARILNAQEDEIASMQAWLRSRGEPVPELHVTGDRVVVTSPGRAAADAHAAMGHGAQGALMPGMLTETQLQQLAASDGRAFERLFLDLMIRHHRGAVTMVNELFAADGAAQDDSVFQLASDIQADQSSEIARMERMLAALSGGGTS